MHYCINVLLFYCITLLLYYCIIVLLYYCITVLLNYYTPAPPPLLVGGLRPHTPHPHWWLRRTGHGFGVCCGVYLHITRILGPGALRLAPVYSQRTGVLEGLGEGLGH